jgi:hypothetical protein
MRWKPREHERDPFACSNRELRHALHVLAVHFDGRAQAERIGAGDRDQGVVGPPNPGNDLAVVEADYELRTHRHVSVEAFDDPDDVRRLAARRHEVDRTHGSLVGLEDRLEDQRVMPVAAT